MVTQALRIYFENLKIILKITIEISNLLLVKLYYLCGFVFRGN